MFYIGSHLSTSGGYLNMANVALSIGANTFQYFTRNPRGSKYKDVDFEDIKAMNSLIKSNNMHSPLAHAPYTYNPCSDKEDIRKYSIDSMRQDIEVLEYIDNSLFNFHPGSHVGQGSELGIKYTSNLLNNIITPNQKTIVLIETMAGKGSEIGKTFDEIYQMMSLVDSNKINNVGVCLDTCHINDAGYDIANNTDNVLDEFDKIIGLNKLYAIHLNDSKNPLGAAKDRHEKIGEGTLGLSGIKNIVNNSRINHLPFYLETPNELDGYAKEIKLINSMLEK